MYVLARHEGEEILIADGLIKIKVLSVTGKIARLGIDAPKEISIKRVDPLDSHGNNTDNEKG